MGAQSPGGRRNSIELSLRYVEAFLTGRGRSRSPIKTQTLCLCSSVWRVLTWTHWHRSKYIQAAWLKFSEPNEAFKTKPAYYFIYDKEKTSEKTNQTIRKNKTRQGITEVERTKSAEFSCLLVWGPQTSAGSLFVSIHVLYLCVSTGGNLSAVRVLWLPGAHL